MALTREDFGLSDEQLQEINQYFEMRARQVAESGSPLPRFLVAACILHTTAKSPTGRSNASGPIRPDTGMAGEIQPQGTGPEAKRLG
jgi:hypothetical protein